MISRKTIGIAIVSVVLLAFLAHSFAQRPVYLGEDDRVVVELHNDLGFDILRKLADDEEGNIVFSPSSIALALSMVYNGAEEETKQAIAQTLGVQDLTLEEVNDASRNIVRFHNHADPDVQLSVANSIWAKKGIEFREDFLERCEISRPPGPGLGLPKLCEEGVHAKIEVLDFESPGAKDTVNSWVKEETRGRIPEILKKIHPLDVMYLLNAIYFKGTWTMRFDKDLTREEKFTLRDGSVKLVPMMRWKKAEELEYLWHESVQAVRLPYGDRERIGMYIFQPENLTSFVQDLNALHGTLRRPPTQTRNDPINA